MSLIARFCTPVQRGIMLALVAGIIVVAGCAQLRKATYPQDFVYLEPRQVRSQMALMSLYMGQIDDILADSSTISSEQQTRLVRILVSIDEVTNRLGAGDIQTSHLVIDEHIDDFKADVNVAIRDARADPPNYFSLGKLAGSCVACHRHRR